MKRVTLLAIWLASFAPLPALASDQLVVSLHPPATAGKGSVKVSVEFTNSGDQPAFVYRPESPFGREDNVPSSDFLRVFDSSGNPVRYTGSRDHWGAISDSHFRRIEPGETVVKEVDISHAYDFGNGGVFTVQYVAARRDISMRPAAHRFTIDTTEAQTLKSNEMVISVGGPSERETRPSLTTSTCSSEQIYDCGTISSSS
ncbi:hypothetical protein [Luteibacter aegosomatissinici]|uniref:hypothetical protein n=1 Tax=Luteibacter aegosomatissinici TaxID=2911539 RepID=UPI001FF85C89|nr:hypothetical protein [Luteibacter aegosomatissinici]UPG95167.1 hypothetical protein L2Y97_03395 [Luteibacter aegosomatissinici]